MLGLFAAGSCLLPALQIKAFPHPLVLLSTSARALLPAGFYSLWSVYGFSFIASLISCGDKDN